VIMGASTPDQVLHARIEFPQQKYLVQSYVDPASLMAAGLVPDLLCRGQCYPCWWDPRTHVYAILTRKGGGLIWAPEAEKRHSPHRGSLPPRLVHDRDRAD